MKTLLKISASVILLAFVFAITAKADFNTSTANNNWGSNVAVPIDIYADPPGDVNIPLSGIIPPGVNIPLPNPDDIDLVFEAAGSPTANFKIDCVVDYAVETGIVPADNHVYLHGLTLQRDDDDNNTFTGGESTMGFVYPAYPGPIGGPFQTANLTMTPNTFPGDGTQHFRVYATAIQSENNAVAGFYYFYCNITATYIP